MVCYEFLKSPRLTANGPGEETQEWAESWGEGMQEWAES